MYNFYKSELNPTSNTGEIGGDISTEVVSGYLGELFQRVDAPPSSSDLSTVYYRKIFVTNDHDFTSSETRLWLDAEQHRGQIAVATQTGTSYSIPSGQAEPTGISSWANPQNYADGLEVGSLAVGAQTGIWIRQTLTSIEEPDPYASLRLYIGGIVE